jgi:hypothetical protein
MCCPCGTGYEAVVQALLIAEAAKDATDKWGYTPLILATIRGGMCFSWCNAVGLSSREGLNGRVPPLAKSKLQGVGWGGGGGGVGGVQVCLEYCLPSDVSGGLAPPSPSCAATSGAGHKAVLQALLAAGAAVDNVSDIGWTALHFAADRGTRL